MTTQALLDRSPCEAAQQDLRTARQGALAARRRGRGARTPSPGECPAHHHGAAASRVGRGHCHVVPGGRRGLPTRRLVRRAADGRPQPLVSSSPAGVWNRGIPPFRRAPGNGVKQVNERHRLPSSGPAVEMVMPELQTVLAAWENEGGAILPLPAIPGANSAPSRPRALLARIGQSLWLRIATIRSGRTLASPIMMAAHRPILCGDCGISMSSRDGTCASCGGMAWVAWPNAPLVASWPPTCHHHVDGDPKVVIRCAGGQDRRQRCRNGSIDMDSTSPTRAHGRAELLDRHPTQEPTP